MLGWGGLSPHVRPCDLVVGTLRPELGCCWPPPSGSAAQLRVLITSVFKHNSLRLLPANEQLEGLRDHAGVHTSEGRRARYPLEGEVPRGGQVQVRWDLDKVLLGLQAVDSGRLPVGVCSGKGRVLQEVRRTC